ncbi:MAG: M13 family metallopeptidase [Bacteroidota bacterium]
MKRHFILLLAACGILFSCHPESSKTPAAPDPLLSHIDSTVRPGDDFFLFANGKWFKENPIPASKRSNGLWQIIQDTINAQVKAICESSAALADAEKGSNKQKIGDFFFSAMDSAAINQKGLAALQADLKMIDDVQDLSGLAKAAAFVHASAGSPLLSFYVSQDDKISSKNAVFLWQGGLSMLERNYYFDTDERTSQVRQKFSQHLVNLFKIMGNDEAKAKQVAERHLKLETALAKTSRNLEDTRDPLKNYHKIAFKQLTQDVPNLDWASFAAGVGLPQVDSVIVGQPEFLAALNGYLKNYPLEDWKNYLKYHLVSSLAPFLDDQTFAEHFSFFQTTLFGVPQPKPRWERAVEQTNASLGELIGQVYVKEHLPEGTKEKLLEIGDAIKQVYAERIQKLDWMSAATKEKALKKLGTVVMKVGYPDKWKDLSALQVDRSSYVRNVIAANQWQFNYMVSKYGKPVDREEWVMQPQTYNAYYNPSNNEIVIPGCNIIVPGYERKLADDAILYSIIGGSTFGHEITHGFDDQGSKYNEFGNLDNWWTPEDSAKFFAKTSMIVRQFNEYVPIENMHINGELTQGENIADLGGTIMGWQAFIKTKQYQSNEIIAGLNPSQRFFLGYALAWMINQRPEYIANQVRSDVHSPPKYRVIGPLSNMPEFYETFGVKEGDAMWRADSLRVKIW